MPEELSNTHTQSVAVDNAIKARLHTIFPDREIASRVVDLIVSKKPKPKGWGTKSTAPYYTEYYALWIKKDIDVMLKTNVGLVYRYDLFCGQREEIMSRTTLYNKINQAIRYLLEYLDDDQNTYKTWRQIVRIDRTNKAGIEIQFIPEYLDSLKGNQPLQAQQVLPTEKQPEWKTRMDNWLESEETRPFVQDRLCLSSDEIQSLKESLSGLHGIEFSVTVTSVKIIRVRQ